MANPFSDEVIKCIALLLQYSSESAVRAAVQKNAEVALFAQGSEGGLPVVKAGDGQLSSDISLSQLPSSMLPGASDSQVAVLEVAESAEKKERGEVRVVVTLNPSHVLQNIQDLMYIWSNEEEGVTLPRTVESKTTVPKAEVVSCILITKRKNTKRRKGSNDAPLGVKELNIQSLDLTKPLDGLQATLKNVYDPLLRQKKEQFSLRAHVQDLMSEIQSLSSVLPEVHIRRYVEDELLKLCDENPNLDVPQLVDKLGPDAKDPSYIRKVLQVRNRCLPVLPMEALLDGQIGEEAAAHSLSTEESVPMEAAMTEDSPLGQDQAEGEESVWLVQRKITYWQRVHAWVEDVLTQLQGKEWRLVHRLLAHRVETSYAAEYVSYGKQIRDYIKFLQTIPERKLVTVTFDSFEAVSTEILDSVMKPSRYPPRLVAKLLFGVVSELATTWTRLNEESNILSEEIEAPDLSLSEDNPQTALLHTVAHPKMTDSSLTGLHTLKELRKSRLLLDHLQQRYKDLILKVSPKLSLRSLRLPAEHPQVYALQQRCMELRDLIEIHFQLYHQLRIVFPHKMRQANRSRRSSLSVSASMSNFAAGEQRKSKELEFSPFHAAETQSNEFAKEMHTAYKKFLVTIGATSGLLLDLDDPKEVRSHSLGPCVWRTDLYSEKRFCSAARKYSEIKDACDEQVALLVSHLLTSEQQSSSSSSRNGLSLDIDVRIFNAYANFRFLPLDKVRKVAQSYQAGVAERIRNYIKQIQENYFSIAVNKREVRFFMTRFNSSPEVAEILREIQLQQLLRDCVVRRDYVSDHGWHQLLSLRNIEHIWRVDKALADFMGYPLSDLVSADLVEGSEVHGCAYALAYLQLIYPEDEPEWSLDPYLSVAQTLVQKESPDSMTFAKDRLLLLGVVQMAKEDRAQIRDIRSTYSTIQQRIQEKVCNWCTYIRQLMSQYAVDQVSDSLCGPIFRVVETTANGAGASTSSPMSGIRQSMSMSRPSFAVSPSRSMSPSKGAPSPARSHLSPSRADFFAVLPTQPQSSPLVLQVDFPWELMTIANDVKYLDKFQLFTGANQGPASVIKDLVRCNEHRFRTAVCLGELLKTYYAAVNYEDEMIAFLATEEYQAVSECLFSKGFTLHWNDDAALAQFTQELAERIMSLVTAVQEVRQRTDAVYSKIRGLHTRTFHPEGILSRAKEISNTVSSLALRSVNTHFWAKQTQSLLDEALLAQIRFLLHGWTLDFLSMRDDSRYLRKTEATDVYHLRPLRVRMRVVYKEVKLESTASAWRHYWIGALSQFFRWVDTIPPLYNDEDIKHEDESGPFQTLNAIIESGKQGSSSVAKWSNYTAGKETGGKSHLGCIYLLSRLPAYAVAEPLNAIESSIADAVALEDEWRQSQQFLNLDVNMMQQRFGSDLRRWSNTIQLMHKVTTQLLDYTQPNRLLGGIVILAEDAQQELSRKLDQITGFVHSKFKDVLEHEIDDMYDKVTEDITKVDALDVIGSIDDAATFLLEAPRLREEMVEREGYVQIMVQSEALLQKLGYILPEDLTNATLVQNEFNALKEMVDRKMKQLSYRRPQLEQTVLDSNADLEKRIQELDNDLKALEGGEVKRTPQAAQQLISELNDRARSLYDEAQKTTSVQEALGLKVFSTAQIERIMEDTERLKEVWDHIGNALTKMAELGETPFFEMVPRRLQEDLQKLEREVDDYPESVKNFPVYNHLVEQIEKALSCRRFMQDLRSDAMSPLERAMRHWVSLRQQLQVNWVLDNLTVQDIWDSDPNENAVIYNDVLELAQGERRIEVQLHQIAEFWDSFTFSLTVYKKQVALVRGWDAVFERLDDDLATFSGMRASPFFSSQQVVAMTNESENRLNQLRQILETLLDVQKRWVYLEGIFTGNAEIRSQLPHDTVQFDRTSRDLMHILPHPRSNGTLPEVKAQFFLEDEKLLMTLERIAAQLTAVQRALTAYLDTQRRRFPRFFFVGDDDLLEILGNSKDPLFLSKHLRKMFTALSSFTVDSTSLTGFSCESEDVRYIGKGVVYKDRNLYDWLNDAEKGMVKTLCSRTIIAAGELSKMNQVTKQWIDQYPAQVMALALQIWWTQLQDKQFSSDKLVLVKPVTKNVAFNQASSPVTTTMDKLINELAKSVLASDITPYSRHKCEQAITVAVYQRDTSRSLVIHQVSSRQDFEWLRVMRLYVENNAVECRMADAMVTHGFEYSGTYERLVQTPLTDKCYLSLMQALHTRLGGSPIGPAGTGKTETVKALGIQTGRHVLVFNCDDTFDYQAVSRIFLGLCQVGAWGCFDEFNRLEERIMSALSQQIQIIQETLRSHQKEVVLNETSVPLHENVSIFITMNPGYAGRSKLPGNLKQLFRTVTMTIPDRETIAEVMLFAQGYQTAEALSLKVVPLFRLCEDQFSRQAHYDFGLRALKSVLTAAGSRKRKSDNEVGRNMDKKVEVYEAELLLESIIATIAPKLVTQDVSLFYPLLLDFFPERTLPELGMTSIREAVLQMCTENGMDPSPAWVEKISQLYHTKETRHGTMIVGPSGTGKTAAWKTLASAMVRVDRQLMVQAYVITPKVLSKGDLFGTLDLTTREWKDGVLTSILRRILDNELQVHDCGVDGEAEDEPSEVDQTPNKNDASPMSPSPRKRSGSYLGFSPLSFGDGSPRNPSAATNAPVPPPPLSKQHWIVFDGDVDPEWVENLNSVLDDNKVLTLPNGERLALPSSVRIFFEVQDLCFATPATVSRCGMVWFNEGTVPLPSLLSYAHHQLSNKRVADYRGRHMRWNFEEDLVGATATEDAGKLANTECVISASKGKVYGEYVYSNASPNIEMILGSSRHRSNSLGDSMLDGDNNSFSARERSTGFDDPNGTVRALNMTVTAKKEHPGAKRIQDTFTSLWMGAFEVNGLIMKGIQLINAEEGSFREQTIMEFDLLQVLQSIFALLWDSIWKSFQYEHESGEEIPDSTLRKIAENSLQYAVVWGIGSGLNNENRSKLAKELNVRPIVNGAEQPVLRCEVNHVTGEWALLRDRVKVTDIMAEQVGANDTVIPTVDTYRHEDLLSSWLGAGRSAILCGPPGSGKTMTIASILNASPEFEGVFLNFSSGTTCEIIIKALEQYCTVRNTSKGFVMSPTSGKKILLFCDEINLPALDQYGTQVAIQLLRQIIERKGFYRTRDNMWITLENVQVVGACNPPTDPGRVPLSLRFLRWAPVILVDFPTKESLQIIYTTYCRAILGFNPSLREEHSSNLAMAMVNMYLQSQKRFTPRIQPHYLYSPRELSRWSRAIFEGFSTWETNARTSMSAASLVRLSIHEGLRVFADRLVAAEEKKWTDRVIDDSFREFFPNVPSDTYQRPLLYSTLLSHAYSDSPREELRKYLQKRLNGFCDEEMPAKMVVFDAMIDHVVRIDRVLRQPLGHVLIAGSSGVGKTVISRLVAWMRGYSAFWLHVHRDYNLTNFEEDLRDLLKRSGCKRERICFIFDESNIMQPAFLEYMNALLASGEVPGLFEGEEWTKLMNEIRDAVAVSHTSTKRDPASGLELSRDANADSNSANRNYVDATNEQDMYRWFLRNVKETLHVIFTINPSNSEFNSRTVTSPALFNRCTIDWFGDWDRSTLHRIADELTKSISLLENSKDSFSSEEAAHSAAVDALCEIHEATKDINAALRVRNANQGTFITPRHFSDFIEYFGQVFGEKHSGSREQLVHLQNGLKNLKRTSDEVAAQKASLTESEREIVERGKKAQVMLDRIVKETDATQKEKASTEEIRKRLQEEESKIEGDRRKVQAELSEAEPALKDAEKALSTVKPEYLREIRAYTTPPPMVKRVLEAVTTLMGEQRSGDWDVLKNYIRRDDFLASVKAFSPANVTDSARDKVNHIMKDKTMTVEAAYRASKAAGPLLQWVVAQVKYSVIFKRVAPMREKIDRITQAQQVQVEKLRETERQIQEKESSLRQLKQEYQTTTEQIAQLKHRIAEVSSKCERATTLVGQLVDERKRWEAEIKNFDTEARSTLGDCILSAAFLAYIGYFDEFSRQEILQAKWSGCLQSLGIYFREHLSVMDFLALPSQRLSWEEAGLPKDRLCVENATILERCTRYTLLIDPSGTASTFLQNYYAKQKINKASFSRPGYLKQLENAVRFGYPIILDDAEFLDPAVAPLLNKEFRRSGGRFITRIGAQDVDISNTFKLFLYTRDPNYQPSPDIAGQVCLLNFTVTLSSLQSQCLHRVLLHERPEIDAKRTALMKVQGEYQLKLRVLEQNLLTLIAKSEGSLLDNNALIDSLADIKKETKGIQEAITDSDASMQLIENTELLYRPVATVTSKIFFALKRFSALSTFYRYNVHFIFKVLEDSLATLPEAVPSDPNREKPSEDDIQRLDLLSRIIVATVHKRVERGMFREDKLVLALRLAQLRSALLTDMAATSDRRLEGLNDPRVVTEEEWGWLLEGLRVPGEGGTSAKTSLDAEIPSVLQKEGLLVGGPQSKAALVQLLKKPAFKEIYNSLKSAANSSKWTAVLLAEDPLDELDSLPRDCFPANIHPVRRMALFTFLLYYVRRDTFVSAANTLLHAFFDGYKDPDVSLSSLGDGNATLAARFFAPHSDITDIVKELSSRTPLLMVSDASHDPSTQIEKLAKETQTTLHVVAMGSKEGVTSVDKYLAETLKDGGWLLLKNTHLDKTYMDRLEKQFHFQHSEGAVHKDFRLFLTADSSAAEDEHHTDDDGHKGNSSPAIVPINLVEESLVVLYEPPPGLKSLLQQTYGTLRNSGENGDQPSPMQRVYLAVAWVHAVISERLFYVPLGWTETYEYSTIEFQRAITAVHSWCTDENTNPPSLSWLALQAVIAATVYGGRVDNIFDQYVLNILCGRVLTSNVFNSPFQFMEKGPLLTDRAVPPLESSHNSFKTILKWIRGLPDGFSNPQWLGLHNAVACLMLSRNAITTVERWSSIQMVVKEELVLNSTKRGNKVVAPVVQVRDLLDTRWSATIKNYTVAWLEPLRRVLSRLEANEFVKKALTAQDASHQSKVLLGSDVDTAGSKNVLPPLELAVQREVLVAVELFRQLVADLGDLQNICDGSRSASEYHRHLMTDLVSDRVPTVWGKYISAHLVGSTGQTGITISPWIADVEARGEHVVQLAETTESKKLHQKGVALGLLFAPGSFLTASKQECGRKEKVALEQLVPQVELLRDGAVPSGASTSLYFTRVALYCAKVNAKGQCALVHSSSQKTSSLVSITTPVTLKWTWVKQKAASSEVNYHLSPALRLSNQGSSSQSIAMPFYVHHNRKALLDIINCAVDLSDGTQLEDWYTRGVSLVAWSPPE